MNGSNAADKILVYNLASIIPENMTTSVAPRVDILPNKKLLLDALALVCDSVAPLFCDKTFYEQALAVPLLHQ